MKVVPNFLGKSDTNLSVLRRGCHLKNIINYIFIILAAKRKLFLWTSWKFKATVVAKINIPITGIETMTSDAYTCLFAVQCPHGVCKMEWIIGDKCTSVPAAKQSLAKKAISILKPLYHFEIRDANYHSIVPIPLDCSLQRESYLTVKERVLGIKDNANPSPSLKEQGFVTPTGLLSQIPCSAIAPLPPKKAKNMRVAALSSSSVPTLSFPMDLSMIFKHRKQN